MKRLQVYKSRPPEQQGEDVEERTVFINNLPRNITEDDVRILFSKAG